MLTITRKKLYEMGMTQAELARRTHCSRQAINLILNGRRISYPIRKRIAEILNIPLEKIFEEDSDD